MVKKFDGWAIEELKQSDGWGLNGKNWGVKMKGKSYSTEERIFILGVLDASGDIKGISRENQIAEQTLRRWRRQMGNQKANETLRREHQKQRNNELKKILADSMLINRVWEAAYRRFPI